MANDNHIIKHCIKYCLHRIKRHGGAGIEKVASREKLKEMLKEFEKEDGNSKAKKSS